jgi:inorganic pyrophosphatase
MPDTKKGDHDPLDICVLSERSITHSEVILNARVVGGLPMNDAGEADDKIIAVLENDTSWADIKDISELPQTIVDRLRHYFNTYKLIPGEKSKVFIDKAYDHKHAERVIEAAIMDYEEEYGA